MSVDSSQMSTEELLRILEGVDTDDEIEDVVFEEVEEEDFEVSKFLIRIFYQITQCFLTCGPRTRRGPPM